MMDDDELEEMVAGWAQTVPLEEKTQTEGLHRPRKGGPLLDIYIQEDGPQKAP